MCNVEPNSQSSPRLFWLVLARVHNRLSKDDKFLAVLHCNNFTNTALGKNEDDLLERN